MLIVASQVLPNLTRSASNEPEVSGQDEVATLAGAPVAGLVAGLMIVVPAVLWVSGWLEPQKGKPGAVPDVAAAATDFEAAEVRTMKVQVEVKAAFARQPRSF